MTWKIWLHGLAAAAITAFCSALSGIIVMPDVFNFTHAGLISTAKMATVPTVVAVCAYMKASPVPALSATLTKTTTVDIVKQ